jgi:hypothetical protein
MACLRHVGAGAPRTCFSGQFFQPRRSDMIPNGVTRAEPERVEHVEEVEQVTQDVMERVSPEGRPGLSTTHRLPLIIGGLALVVLVGGFLVAMLTVGLGTALIFGGLYTIVLFVASMPVWWSSVLRNKEEHKAEVRAERIVSRRHVQSH